MEMEVQNSELSPLAVPASAADSRALQSFALTFDGYAHWGDRCGPLAEAAATAFRTHGALPSDLSDLRACLFYEQQRWRWENRPPDADALSYMQALLDAIRAAASTPA